MLSDRTSVFKLVDTTTDNTQELFIEGSDLYMLKEKRISGTVSIVGSHNLNYNSYSIKITI